MRTSPGAFRRMAPAVGAGAGAGVGTTADLGARFGGMRNPMQRAGQAVQAAGMTSPFLHAGWALPAAGYHAYQRGAGQSHNHL
jgi:hypothetical protein